jgi:hypothetical protein
MISARIIGNLCALPIIGVRLIIELGKLAYAAVDYAAIVVYDGIRHGHWYR